MRVAGSSAESRRSVARLRSLSHDPGAAVPVGLDSAGKTVQLQVELIRKPCHARLDVELERLAGLEPHELSSSRSLVARSIDARARWSALLIAGTVVSSIEATSLTAKSSTS